MAKKPLPPVVLPTVRIERTEEPAGAVDLTNVVHIDTFRHRKERAAEERQRDTEPPADT